MEGRGVMPTDARTNQLTRHFKLFIKTTTIHQRKEPFDNDKEAIIHKNW